MVIQILEVKALIVPNLYEKGVERFARPLRREAMIKAKLLLIIANFELSCIKYFHISGTVHYLKLVVSNLK